MKLSDDIFISHIHTYTSVALQERQICSLQIFESSLTRNILIYFLMENKSKSRKGENCVRDRGITRVFFNIKKEKITVLNLGCCVVMSMETFPFLSTPQQLPESKYTGSREKRRSVGFKFTRHPQRWHVSQLRFKMGLVSEDGPPLYTPITV